MCVYKHNNPLPFCVSLVEQICVLMKKLSLGQIMSLLTIWGVLGSLMQGRVENLKGPFAVSLYCGKDQNGWIIEFHIISAALYLVNVELMSAILYRCVVILHQFQVRYCKRLCSTETVGYEVCMYVCVRVGWGKD